MIYLDYNSTTKVAPEVLKKMNEAYALPLNASASHQLGRKASKFVEDARTDLKNLLNAQNYDVIFTASSTEATNMVMFGIDVSEILFCTIEHASVYSCRPSDKKITELAALGNGLVDVSDLEKKLNTPYPPQGGSRANATTEYQSEASSLRNKNFLVSVMLANNETGAIQPIEKISQLVHQKGGLIHCDIVQAVGKIEIDLEKLNVDFASVSAHKISGPQGVGALLIRKGLDIKPLIFGAKQEKGKRAGTINVAGIAGFGEACKIAAKKLPHYENVKKLRDFLENEIQKIGKKDAQIFSTEIVRLPNTSYIATRGIDAQTQLINFDLNGICVSAGPACSSGTLAESRILKAMKIAPEFSTSAIRVSLGCDTTKNEIEKFISVWQEFYEKNKN
jgi:cysteine desulfurase